MSRFAPSSQVATSARPDLALQSAAMPVISQMDQPAEGTVAIAARPALQSSGLICGPAASN